jgi:regulator of cell morphogenesis and NO signaling
MSADRPATAAMSVGELLAGSPRASVVFEVVGIDTCCGHSKSLAEAAAAAHIDAGEVVDLLEGREVAPAPAPDRDAPLTEITQYIVAHFHRRARSTLVALTELSRQACTAHADRLTTLWNIKDAIEQLVRELVPHMRGEERYHFRYIDSMQTPELNRELLVPLYGTIQYPLHSLRHDHSRDLTAMADLRVIASDFNPPASSCERVQRLYALLANFERELQQHVQIEDQTLFPRAVEMERKLATV